MKKHVYIILSIIIILLIVSGRVSSVTGLKLTNQERFFLRLSEKYDKKLNEEWFDKIIERENIIKEIKNNNDYDKYIEYIKSLKKINMHRIKNKYIKKLNCSVKLNDTEKIKRYLRLILNIFSEENKRIKLYFDIF